MNPEIQPLVTTHDALYQEVMPSTAEFINQPVLVLEESEDKTASTVSSVSQTNPECLPCSSSSSTSLSAKSSVSYSMGSSKASFFLSTNLSSNKGTVMSQTRFLLLTHAWIEMVDQNKETLLPISNVAGAHRPTDSTHKKINDLLIGAHDKISMNHSDAIAFFKTIFSHSPNNSKKTTSFVTPMEETFVHQLKRLRDALAEGESKLISALAEQLEKRVFHWISLTPKEIIQKFSQEPQHLHIALYCLVAVLENDAELDLGKCDINVAGIKLLAKALQYSRTLNMLNLSDNKLNDEEMQILAKELKTNKTIRVLALAKNEFSVKGTAALAKMLTLNRTLTALDLSDNNLKDEGIQILAEGLKINKTIQILVLEHNKFSVKGTAALAKMLTINSTLHELDLSNNFIYCVGATHLAESLTKNKSLFVLNLRGTKISADGTIALANMLNNNTTLTCLDLGTTSFTFNNRIFERGADALKTALEKNNTLLHLYIGSNYGYAYDTHDHGLWDIPLYTLNYILWYITANRHAAFIKNLTLAQRAYAVLVQNNQQPPEVPCALNDWYCNLNDEQRQWLHHALRIPQKVESFGVFSPEDYRANSAYKVLILSVLKKTLRPILMDNSLSAEQMDDVASQTLTL